MTYYREVLADAPSIFIRWNERNTDNPLDHGVSQVTTMGLGAGYFWGVPGALCTDTNRAIRFPSGAGTILSFNPRKALTASQTRLCWVRTTSTDATTGYAGDPAMTIMGDSTGSVWDGFGIHGGKVRYVRFNNSAWQTFDSALSVNDGRWHLIGMTYDSVSLAVAIYVDGAPDGGGTMTAHQGQGGIDRIGRGQAADFYEGDLDETEIHTAVLAPERFRARWLKGGRRRAAGIRSGRAA